ncbi:MAG: hypothetical protein B7Y02_13250 [Rhodobacterales bacterium 17-64-5]|nr:MAG: hypothetical protein B7Y02_13250 [Rhodobacterales bacterium 17-64-5]
MRWLTVLLGLSLASAAWAEVDVPRDAACLLVVDGAEVIRGTCKFTPIDRDGSFTISGLNGKYFAYVLVGRPGRAEGFWNGTAYAGKAHYPLGDLYREDACWVNDRASVCAW